MNMSSYETDKIDHSASQYDEEVLYAGWIPDMALQPSPGMEQRVTPPESLVTVSADIFLNKMYSLQR
jgi:hypothetical protein